MCKVRVTLKIQNFWTTCLPICILLAKLMQHYRHQATITGDLLQHNDVLVRKTALSMFIEKIEDVQGSLTEEEIVMFLDMLEPIKSRLSSAR